MRKNCSKCPAEAQFVIKDYEVYYCAHDLAERPLDTQAMAVPVNSDTAVKTEVRPYPSGATALQDVSESDEDYARRTTNEQFPPFTLNDTDMTWLASH
jgi:hypothetical protein